MAFRDHDELGDSLNQGNFNAILNLVINKNPELKQQWDNVCSGSVIKCFRKWHQLSSIFCVHCRWNNGHLRKQFFIVVQLIESSVEIQEYFVGFYDVNEDKTANGLYYVFCSTLGK